MNTKNSFLPFNNTRTAALCVLCSVFMIGGISVADAAVVSRGRTPVVAQRTAPRTAASESETAPAASSVETVPAAAKSAAKSAISEMVESADDSEIVIENKTNQFSEILSDETESISASSDSDLAKKIREQRAALDNASASAAVTQKITASAASGRNMCDANLRACMQEKCGQDYSKCAGDTDTLWGDKMDACRRDLPCTGHEYALFSAEIKADRDMNARIASYNSIVDCGNQYNDCIITECGIKFDKCLGKKAGDTAISKCEKIARNCREQDSGLASRMMDVFGTLRQDAEKQVQRDVERLYELRDLMRGACNRLGAMFDERSLDCVYSVEFRAGEKNTLFASKKLYAGDTFNCDQNWFGIDITTFKENAYRATREQKSATSALLGSGVGTAAGAISSGVIDRAIDRHKAERAVKKAEKENAKADEIADQARETETDEKVDNDDNSSTGEGKTGQQGGQGSQESGTTGEKGAEQGGQGGQTSGTTSKKGAEQGGQGGQTSGTTSKKGAENGEVKKNSNLNNCPYARDTYGVYNARTGECGCRPGFRKQDGKCICPNGYGITDQGCEKQNELVETIKLTRADFSGNDLTDAGLAKINSMVNKWANLGSMVSCYVDATKCNQHSRSQMCDTINRTLQQSRNITVSFQELPGQSNDNSCLVQLKIGCINASRTKKPI